MFEYPLFSLHQRNCLSATAIRVLIKCLFVAFLLLCSVSQVTAQCYTPRSSGEIALALEKLKIFGSVLYVAAHPDDENSALLAYLANGQLLRTAYLSLNRGEGGQNLVGAEKGIALGILRTAELVAAREVDKAEQLFTSAYDFGYSESLEETFREWDKETLIGDVVWAIRKFQPDIVITRFPITGEGRHAQHTASGILAEEAFQASGDPKRFPEQLALVSPWQARTLLLNNIPAKWDPRFTPEGKIAVDVGEFNPFLGKSYGEIAAESRNNHKSQGFGTSADAGPRVEYFTWRFGEKPSDQPFAKSQFRLDRIPGTEALVESIDRTIKRFRSAESAERVTEALLEVRGLIDRLLIPRWRMVKLAEVDRLLLDISGMKLEALSENSALVAGAELETRLRILRRQETSLAICKVQSPWSKPLSAGILKTAEWMEIQNKSKVPENTAPSNLYWLKNPMRRSLFSIPDRSLLGPPFPKSIVSASFVFCRAEHQFTWTCPVSQKTLNQKDGDRYVEALVVPPVTMNFEGSAQFVPKGAAGQLSVEVTAAAEGIAGRMELIAPPGWKVEPSSFSLKFSERDIPQRLLATIKPLSEENQESKRLRAVFYGENGKTSHWSRRGVSYSHIRSHSYLQPAEIILSTAELVAPKLRIGYIMGAGDEIPQALNAIGYSTVLLEDETLKSGDLSRFDTIVAGVRALNTRKAWSAFFPRLMDFVRHGGTLLVQYSANDNLNKVPDTFAPFPFTLSPNRITDETANVRFLLADHRLVKNPNLLTSKDFDGWVQERGLWFARNVDTKYHAPFEMNDPGKPPDRGALIVTEFGKGKYIYTGLSFFRQLPAGNPGAYRLFVNLLHWGHSDETR